MGAGAAAPAAEGASAIRAPLSLASAHPIQLAEPAGGPPSAGRSTCGKKIKKLPEKGFSRSAFSSKILRAHADRKGELGEYHITKVERET